MSSADYFTTVQSQETPGVLFEIVHYHTLQGSGDLNVAEKIFIINQTNMQLKMIRARLDKGQILIEPGALYFMKGQLELESGVQGGVARGLMRKFMTGETLFQSKIKGTGEVYLEPTFGYYLLFNMDNDALIVDKGAFCCASSGLEVSARMQKNISSALFGGEGLFQTEIKGSGTMVLNSPVPVDELLMYELAPNEKLSVDGNFAFARTASVGFQVEKSGKSLFQSVTSGEGLLQTFTGPGLVWVAPTQHVYEKINQLDHASTLMNEFVRLFEKREKGGAV